MKKNTWMINRMFFYIKFINQILLRWHQIQNIEKIENAEKL